MALRNVIIFGHWNTPSATPMFTGLFNCIISVGPAVKTTISSAFRDESVFKIRLTKPNKSYTTVTWQDDKQLLGQYYVYTN